MSEEAKVKRPVGRPSKYDPAFCQDVIDMAREGKGWAHYASKFEIDRATLYDWAASHEEFSTALKRAKVLEQEWWEEQARSNLRSKEFNANLWIKSAQARFRDDYTERKETALTGADGGAVKIESTSKIDARALDPEAREALKQALLAAQVK
jgi:hypothetical protein